MELNAPFYLADVSLDLMLRLGGAVGLGLLMGLDREMRDKAAGLRTHGLVCFSAAAMTVSVIALWHQAGGKSDPLRLYEAAAGFIGIIGAGLIIFSKGELKNLTTAAHLWLTTVVGMACGAGQWPLVLVCAVVSLLMLSLLGWIEARWVKRG